jgi:drug/metabolite transporter (DMT)-like permease
VVAAVNWGFGRSALMILGLLLALVSALATNVAFLLKHRGAVLDPPIRVRHPLGSAAGLFRSRWFAIGWMVAVVAWLLHVGALSLAPLSIVQAVMSGGIVFLAVLGERYFGFRLGRWQWVVTITAAGLAVIGFTGGGATRPQRSSLAAMIAVEGAIVAVAATVLAISAHRAVLRRAEGLLLGLGAGALFGVSNVAIKFLTHAEGPIHGLLSPWTLTALIAGAISFYASPTRAGRRGDRPHLRPPTSPPSSAASSSSTNRSARARSRSAPASSPSAWSSPARRSCPGIAPRGA